MTSIKKKNGSSVGKLDSEYESDKTEDFSNSEEEGKSSYRRGGYHPVKIGDVYNNRYTVHTKLGWGHFSTVWLATDSKVANDHPHKCVALKIQKSATQYTEAAEDEIELLWTIKSQKGNGSDYVVQLLNHFKIYGPNGKHVCMVFEVMGKNLLYLIKKHNYRGIPLEACKRIAYQMLVGLDFLHTKCKIIHTDLKPENFLMALADLPDAEALLAQRKASEDLKNLKFKEALKNLDPENKMSKTQRRKMKQKLKKQAELEAQNTKSTSIAELVKKKSETAKSTKKVLPNETATSKTEKKQNGAPGKELFVTKISDLGNGCWVHKHFTDDITTRQYRSPEVILGLPYSCPTDVWSVACMVFELVTGDYLFDPKEDKYGKHSRDEDHLALMVELLGKMPKKMCQQGKHSREFFNRKGELRNIKKLDFWGLEDILIEKYKFDAKEGKLLADFLYPMLIFSAKQRITAGEALKNPWLASVAKDYPLVVCEESHSKDSKALKSDTS